MVKPKILHGFQLIKDYLIAEEIEEFLQFSCFLTCPENICYFDYGKSFVCKMVHYENTVLKSSLNMFHLLIKIQEKS